MIRGNKRQVSLKNEMGLKASIHNRFDIEVIDSKTGTIKQKAQAENVICTNLWSRLFGGNTYFTYIHYGSGTGTPASTDTSLFTYVGGLAVTDGVDSWDPANGVYSRRQQIQLLESVSVGVTITEVGVAYGSSSSYLCTHAMLKDMNGNQISIAKTDTDIINIYATIFVHWDLSYHTGDIQITYSNTFMQVLAGVATTLPTYFTASKSRRYNAYNGYTAGKLSATRTLSTKTILLTAARIPAASGNVPFGISSINIGFSAGGYNYGSDGAFCLKTGGTWFPGSTITAEAIGTGDGSTVDFSTAFDFPSTATIYIDGVEETNVTVDQYPLDYQDMGGYFDEIEVVDEAAYPKLNVYQYSWTYAPGNGLHGVYYNPYYALGIYSFTSLRYYPDYIRVSNDLSTWVTIDLTSVSDRTRYVVPEAYRNYKYWEVPGAESNDGPTGIGVLYCNTGTGKNIHFTTAPTSGAVITADYTTPTIAKDTNHVFDLSVTITLAEYTA